MACILFIVVLNKKEISAQSNHLACINCKVLIQTQQKTKDNAIDAKQKVYTVFLARTFPVIENTNDNLPSMEGDESVSYDLLYKTSVDENIDLPSNFIEITKIKESSKNHKIKIIQKLNS
ncbi:hypothetical protein [Aurantibacillus circumpalustris]|uniref:hypothetical protein n=1 Tax=Aurantibacillus circumpalustris TaxID=3036359 RepID=UPI00295C0156|nr:hypothetical protein [Aurantibacillus circumpalustris]